jgi:hypothetical protein
MYAFSLDKKPMQKVALACLFLAMTLARGQDGAAFGMIDLDQASPDGKWLFQARWHAVKPIGYLCDIKNVATGKICFADDKPAPDDVLPPRLSARWSPDSHYVAIYFEYSHRLYGIKVVHCAKGKARPASFPSAEGKTMIKTEDRKRWDGSGMAISSTDGWSDHDILNVDDEMITQLNTSGSGPQHIDSDRKRSIQFTGATGHVIRAEDPQY